MLDAAVGLVAERGLRGLTYRAIADRAGVGHTLVAHHFGSVDALLEAALEHSLRRSVDSVTARPGSGDVRALFAGLSAFASEQSDGEAFQFELILEARRRPELREHVTAIYDAYLEAIDRELVLAGLDTSEGLSHLVYAVADGLVFNQVAHGRPKRTEQALAHLRRLLLADVDDAKRTADGISDA